MAFASFRSSELVELLRPLEDLQRTTNDRLLKLQHSLGTNISKLFPLIGGGLTFTDRRVPAT